MEHSLHSTVKFDGFCAFDTTDDRRESAHVQTIIKKATDRLTLVCSVSELSEMDSRAGRRL